jgi:hypothetical protein
MAVVINEFEVAPAEAAPKRSAEGEPAAAAAEPEKPKDHEIERMMARHAERCERVWAH